jgi:hypothetical protein
MSHAEFNDWLIFGVKSSAVVVVIVYFKKILALIRESFGRIDKSELCSMLFSPVLIFMIWSEQNRQHEWQYYSPLEFGAVTLIVMWGFGLRPVLKYFLLLKGVDPKSFEDEKSQDTGDGFNNPDTANSAGKPVGK